MRHLFFDFDMTLGYRITMWTATVRELLLEECVVAREDDIRPFTRGNGYPWNRPDLAHAEFFNGKGWWQNSQDFIREGLIDGNVCDAVTAARVADAFPARFTDIRYWRTFKDVRPALSLFRKRGYGLHILSNHVPEAREIIIQLGLMEHFDSATLSAEAGYEKPNKRIFDLAKDSARVRGGDVCVMIGDNYERDVLGGLGAGMRAVLVREKNVNEYKYYSRNFNALPEIVEKAVEDNETR